MIKNLLNRIFNRSVPKKESASPGQVVRVDLDQIGPAAQTEFAELARESSFWEDLSLEDPPPAIPELELPPLKAVTAPVSLQSSKIGDPVCPQDGFPMLMINGHLECSVEYIERCIGGQPVIDMVQRGSTMYLIFENGHQLPLLCGCCGGSLSVPDLAKERKFMRGRRLEAMSMASNMTKDGRKFNELVLKFSKAGFFSRGLAEPVSFEVAVQMRHPADCLYHKRISSAKKKQVRKKDHRKG